VVPGILLTHISVGKLVPAISDLPTNVVTGFDAVFRFGFMEQDAKDIKASCSTVLAKCNVSTDTCGNTSSYPGQPTQSVPPNISANDAKYNISKSFDNSLAVVKRIAEDKYFGTPGLQDTVTNLNKLTAEMAKIDATMPCFAAVPVFCELHSTGDAIVDGMGQVNAEIDKFKKSDIVDRWEEYSALLTALHCLPYILVIGMMCFTFYWCRGGVCCCCKGGTKTGFCLILYVLFWLLSFVIYFVVCAAGSTIKFASDRIEIPVLEGKPSLKDAIEHIQTNYPEFWSVVFEDLEEGLDLLLNSSFFFVVAALLIALYSMCVCCCRPYGGKKGDN